MLKQRPTLFPLPLIGWKEHVSLPKLGLGPIIAKVDTGARSAALHADDIKVRGNRVTFTIINDGAPVKHSAPLLSHKRVKSSNGQSETRPVIEALIRLGTADFDTEVTLTDRTEMGVAMLLGRNAIRGRFLVNPARTFLLSRKKKKPS